MVGVAAPSDQVDGLHFAEPERRTHLIDGDWQVTSTLLGDAGFVANETACRSDGQLGPGDDYALRMLEMLFDLVPPFGSAANVLVPPDADAIGLKRPDKRRNARPVLCLVGYENFAHALPPRC